MSEEKTKCENCGGFFETESMYVDEDDSNFFCEECWNKSLIVENIKLHIPIICPECGSLNIGERCEDDPEDAIIGECLCPKCIEEGGYGQVVFFKKGEEVI